MKQVLSFYFYQKLSTSSFLWKSFENKRIKFNFKLRTESFQEAGTIFK